MIELKNITKKYKSKKGLSTEALKGINLQFEENGLVFILGKSGSGKSTLLNILGGLDKYTSGELIVNGKSSKNFSNSDWDAYRNTYMGFVFQEFNLIDNYTVYQNIKLSLELQNVKPTKEEVLKVLDKVGLKDVLKRKPNELSGGQKQRIAIARALIKNSEIILADEPTGNLDSATSKQIFDLLKELSKEKLVIVVTHDSESAKKYADRIISISDGLIVSDSKKVISKNQKKFKLIKAKLPMRYSLRMGFENLFHKKIKLLISIILITLCLTCLGIMFSATTFDMVEEHINTLQKNKEYEISVSNYEKYQDMEALMKRSLSEEVYTEFVTLRKTKELNDSIIKEAEEKTGLNWYKENIIYQNSTQVYIKLSNSSQTLYYSEFLLPTFIETNENDVIDNLLGSMPKASDEIVISSYIADNIIKNGIYLKKENNISPIYKPNSYEQIIKESKYIQIENLNKAVKIVGIIEFDLENYEELKTITWDEYMESLEYDTIYNEFVNSKTYNRIYVNNDFIDNQDLKENNILKDTTKLQYNGNISVIEQASYLINDLEYYDGNKIVKNKDITDNEVIIDLNVLNDITNGDYQKKLEDYINNNYFSEYYSVENFSKEYIKNNKIIGSNIKSGITKEKIVKSLDNYVDYKIKGIVLNESLINQIYLSKNILINNLPKSVSSTSMFTVAKTPEEMRSVFSIYPIDKSYTISTTKYSDSLIECTTYIYMIELVGKYGSVFFLVLSLLIIINFISTSISYRKKEIGILRALGCKGKDILKMFINEMIILITTCLLFANIFINKVVLLFNGTISDYIKKDINFLVYSNKEFMYLIGIILIMVLVSSILPIVKLTRTKPIDTILDK